MENCLAEFLMIYAVDALLFLIVLRLLGYWLDRQTEKSFHRRYQEQTDGILPGLASQAQVNGHQTAVIFVHGFTDSAKIFDQFMPHLKGVDWFVPLNPFHGRNLEEMLDFDPFVIEEYITSFIQMKQKSYQRLILVGQSLGGLVLLRIAQQQKWNPQQFQLVLMAPALFLKTNSLLYRTLFGLYLIFRNYYPHGPTTAADRLAYQPKHFVNWGYYVIPAVQRLHYYSRVVESNLKTLHFPHTLFIAKGDGRIDITRLQKWGRQHKACDLRILGEGKHQLYWSHHVHIIVHHVQNCIDQE
ncbi:alpha/beta fold hydrolase [Deltaproteobacteria bacterium TL4]